ncbi:MAG TPA: pilus assembly protein TadG-related protein [Modicisalibacter sp.]|nr:pilus assembly protein TadG-related protein [Modicisalibacter sp.]
MHERGGWARRRARQAGQILPVMLFGFFVTIVSLLAVFNTSQVTIKKTQLVNAADAAAYSGAIQAARTMNFMAYSNRAMVANTIAVGYIVSYASWLRYFGDMLENLSPRGLVKNLVENNGENALEELDNADIPADTKKSISGDVRDLQNDSRNGLASVDRNLNCGNCASDPGGNMQDKDFSGNNGATQNAQPGGFKAIANKLRKGGNNALKSVATILGYATVGPSDLLNLFYAGTQVATYAAAPSVIGSTMQQVAQSYDANIRVTDPVKELVISWMLPTRPGLDTLFLHLPKHKVNINVLTAMTGIPQIKKLTDLLPKPLRPEREVKLGRKSMDLGIMKNFIEDSMTDHDRWWIGWNRGFRVCALIGPICLAPLPLPNFAINKKGKTDLFMAHPPDEDKRIVPWGNTLDKTNESLAGTDMRAGKGTPAATIGDQAERNGGSRPTKSTGGVFSAKAKALKQTVRRLQDKLESSPAGKQINFARFIADYQPKELERRLAYGADWQARDELKAGPYRPIIPSNVDNPLNPFDWIKSGRFKLISMAKGEATAKEFYPAYQGVPLYFMLAEIPFTSIHPRLVIDANLTLELASMGLSDSLGLGSQQTGTLHASSSAKVFYVRQQDYFADIESHSSLSNLMWRYVDSTNVGEVIKNWYGETAYYTARNQAKSASTDKWLAQRTEFPNLFNPFWEVRLVDG